MCSCEDSLHSERVRNTLEEKNPFYFLLNIKLGEFNISKVVVAYFVGRLISQEVGLIVAIDIMITEFFNIATKEKSCSCEKNK